MRVAASLCVVTLASAACGEASAPRAPLSVSPAAVQLNVGDTARIVASDVRTALAWRTTAPSVASVDMRGLVAAITPGSALVWAIRGADSAAASVQVFAVKCAGSPRISPATATLAVGDTIRAYAQPGCSSLARAMSWTSSDPGIAGVVSRGALGSNAVAVIRALGAGAVTVTVRSDDDPTISVAMAVVVR
jgi:uncharacterized protein YjdB